MEREKSVIQHIEIEKIKIHPNNVRKTYADIEELAESIKAKGVLQNLTVVPDTQEPGTYLTVIGNRRLTAAKMVGLETVPCYVTEMDEREQTSVMLLENMQRTDLTPYEQAQGFQMMLDFGETVESITEKTGFSETTVRHRVNMAKLDQEKLREREKDESFQLTLTDLYSLEKVEDIESRNKILENAKDSKDLVRMAENAAREAKRNKAKEKLIGILMAKGIEKAPEKASQEIYTNKWNTKVDFDLDGDFPTDEELEKHTKDIAGLFYMEYYRSIRLIKKAEKVEKVKTEADIEREEQNKKKKGTECHCKRDESKNQRFCA